jgi:hypothetical protein
VQSICVCVPRRGERCRGAPTETPSTSHTHIYPIYPTDPTDPTEPTYPIDTPDTPDTDPAADTDPDTD